MRVARRPSCVSVSELFTEGFLNERDIRPGGYVFESTRVLAEQQYWTSRNRPTTAMGVPRPHRTAASVLNRLESVLQTPTTTGRVPKVWTFDTCSVCFAGDKDHVCVPCFHLCVCVECVPRLTRCPICRAPSTTFRKVYLS